MLQRTPNPWILYLSGRLTSLVGSSEFHAVGTAAISQCGVPWGVLDPDLRVKGTKGLRVVDASALPYAPTGHSMSSPGCEVPVVDYYE